MDIARKDLTTNICAEVQILAVELVVELFYVSPSDITAMKKLTCSRSDAQAPFAEFQYS